MRLIDADRALKIVRDQGIAHPNAYYLTNYAMLMLREAPTVDVAEVVRCKYCKYFGLNDENVPYCSNRFGLDDPEPNGFCNYGIEKN